MEKLFRTIDSDLSEIGRFLDRFLIRLEFYEILNALFIGLLIYFTCRALNALTKYLNVKTENEFQIRPAPEIIEIMTAVCEGCRSDLRGRPGQRVQCTTCGRVKVFPATED